MPGTANSAIRTGLDPHSGLRGPRPNVAAFGITLLLHAAVLAGLLAFEPTRTALQAAAPIMIDLIVPSEVKPPPPPPKPEKPVEHSKPRPVAKALEKQVEPLPILTVPAEVPTPVAVAPQPPPPAAPSAADAVPVPANVPAVVTQPIFNADYLDNPPPAYPPLSRRVGEQGRVILRVLVGTAGRAEEVQIRTTSGSTRLDEAARTTVMRWKFVPAKRGEEAISAWVLIPISFNLQG